MGGETLMVEIIAEFGCNWNTIQDFRMMVLFCKELGIKYIKLQMWKPEQAPKEVRHMYIGKGRAKYMFNFAKRLGIELFFSVMYPEAVDICEKIGVNYYKIRYIDRNNHSLYRKVKKTSKILFISVDNEGLPGTLYNNLFIYHPNRVIALRVVPHYPATFEEYNPNYYMIGYSDHTPDFQLYNHAKKDSVFIEMHLCLDKKKCFEGKWSKELREIREVLDNG